jgi:DNA-binding NarL/FixJ family response regulator
MTPGNGQDHGPHRLRILIVDEHNVFAGGLQSILQQPDIEVVGLARTAEQAFSAVSIKLPDVVLLCILAKSTPAESSASRALSALASSGFGGMPTATLASEDPRNENGYVVLEPPANRDGLTPRELQVLTLLMDGASNKEMAKRLQIRSNTVRTHVQNVLTKLRVHTRLGAVSLAMRKGLTYPNGTTVMSSTATQPPVSFPHA